MAELLKGFSIVNMGYNLPAPLASSRLAKLGARIIKIEPPAGDPFKEFCSEWYQDLITGIEMISLNLKTEAGRNSLFNYLAESDCLITSNRLESLCRLQLTWKHIHEKLPNICMVSIFGHPHPYEDIPGHDLTYQAKANLLNPPDLPKSLLADLWGAEKVVQAVLGVLLYRNLTGEPCYETVALSEAVQDLALPLKHSLTIPEGLLGGNQARYNLYRTINGWIALAALEEKFWQKFLSELEIKPTQSSKELLTKIFLNQTSEYWEQWGKNFDIPIVSLPR